MERSPTPNILQTKFFKPRLSVDYVERKKLLDKLSSGDQQPFVLVSAPAGYGKSTSISGWIEQEKHAYSWLSLGQEDNDLFTFLNYFIESIRKTQPSFAIDLLQFLKAPEQPSTSVLVTELINELAQFREPFYSVMDDYHYINRSEIHDFISSLLQFPIPNFHLVIITRRDPPFPISRYRAKHQILEIRAADLSFSDEYAIQFLEKSIGRMMDPAMAADLNQQTEGWITGLRLFAVKLAKDPEHEFSVNKNHRFFVANMLNELITDFPADSINFLMKTALLDQFNTELALYICENYSEGEVSAFISYLESSNIFLIPLDDQLNWYRFHHLFSDLLRRELEASFSKKEIKHIHIRAGEWYQRKNYFEQAIRHFTEAREFKSAVDLVNRHRISLLNDREWISLERILNYFPEEYIAQNGSLLLLRAWQLVYHGQTFEMFHMIDSVKNTIESQDLADADKDVLLGECYCLLTYKIYHFDQDFDACIELGEKALKLLPQQFHYPIGYAWIFVGGALQAKGRTTEAIKRLYEAIDQSDSEDLKNMVLLVVCFIYWLESDSDHLKKSSTELIEYGTANNNTEAIVNGYLFLGCYHYMTGELNDASMHFNKVLAMRYHVIGVLSFFGITALAFTQLYRKEFDKLNELIVQINKIINEIGGQVFRAFWKGFEAEIKMFRSQTPQALNWLKTGPEIPLVPISNYSDPHLSMIRISLMQGSQEYLTKANTIMDQVEEMVIRTNNRRVAATIHVGKAIYFHKIHDLESSATHVTNALKIAELGNNVMIFVEYGESIIPILQDYIKQKGEHALLTKAIELIKPGNKPNEQPDFTNRELEIIPLLNLSNKEIAQKLFIAEKTVKRHSNSIFKKLHVKNRREALHKAIELKLV